jgi:cellulase
MHELFVNGVSPGNEVGLRMPPSNSPVTDLTSDDMACNVGGSKVPSGVKTIDAAEGDTIKVKWDNSGHPGPITHFLFGPVDDASQATGIGAGWFKIDEVNQVDGKWASEIMAANNMTHEFKLPTGLATGEYLLRSEMLALHSSQTKDGAQFYIGCSQLKIKGTGSKGACGPTISLPGAYKADDKNVYIPNYYNGFDATTYKAPGGPVASCGAGAGGSAPAPAPAESSAAASATGSATPTAAASATASAPASASAAPVVSEAATPTKAAPTPSASSGSGSDAGLPEKFTVDTFVSWLTEKAGSPKARRAHPRSFA